MYMLAKNVFKSCFIICLYVHCIRDAPRLCDYSFLKKIVKNGKRNLLG